MPDLSLILPPAVRSAPRARDALRSLMGTWADEETREDALLLLTELVANGVVHARSSLAVHLTVAHDGLRAEVRDESPLSPMLRIPDESGGRGVLILNVLASRWGCSRTPGPARQCGSSWPSSALLARPRVPPRRTSRACPPHA